MQAFIQGRISSTAVALESEPAALFRDWVQEGKDDQDWVVSSVLCDTGHFTDTIWLKGRQEILGSRRWRWYLRKRPFHNLQTSLTSAVFCTISPRWP